MALDETANLEPHVDQALEGLEICSSDPLCAETQREQPSMSVHGAACHNCLFLPETSRERGNRYLDRTTPVPTMELTHCRILSPMKTVQSCLRLVEELSASLVRCNHAPRMSNAGSK